ncbi:MAG: alpha-N-acetylglucosaminidase C-terminal domain-containing protein, partial [Bacteroidota bacterium]|nr:alpha-N-acetylglucosaminidase C-terminal domain-containing protein [Bacteroidota bacterium]
KNYYEQDARKIITVWGEPESYLSDYANRSWAGLIKTYYRGRWKMFIDEIELSLKNKTVFNDTSFSKKLAIFEDQWTKGREKYSPKPIGDCMAISRKLIEKYKKFIEVN